VNVLLGVVCAAFMCRL